jgi:hypothetical protein
MDQVNTGKYMRQIAVLLCAVTFLGCAVQKRHYMKGFYVERKSRSGYIAVSANAAVKTPGTLPGTNAKVQDPAGLKTIIQDYPILSAHTESQRRFTPLVQKKEDCDLIVLRSAEEVKGKVVEITTDLIKYKRCDMPDGPVYSVRKSEVFMIKYANGSKEIINPEGNKGVPAADQKTTTETPAAHKKMHPYAIASFVISIALLVSLMGEGIFVALGALAVASVIFAIVALGASAKEQWRGRGLAITAIVLSTIFSMFLLLAVSLM